MPFQVTIQPSGHVFNPEDDESILSAALREGYTLPYGCRNGACGSCKGKLLSGTVSHVGKATALSDVDRAEGKALFCVARATSDIHIECREVGAAKDIQIRTLPCRVHTLNRLSPSVMLLQLKLPAGERLQFLPGQYLDILLKNGQRRSFSIANPPHDDALLHLHVGLVENGQFTNHVFNTMKEKDILRIEGPLGSFFLREDSRKPVLLIASGTGYAPVNAMLSHALYHHHDRQFTLYRGAKTHDELYCNDAPLRWTHEHPNFTYVPILSRATDACAWDGRQGRLTDTVASDFTDLSAYQVYACGAPIMVEAARVLCLTRGLPEEEFFYDAFTLQSSSD